MYKRQTGHADLSATIGGNVHRHLHTVVPLAPVHPDISAHRLHPPARPLQSIHQLRRDLDLAIARRRATNPQHIPIEEFLQASEHFHIKAVFKGMLKVMYMMGISTYQSYCGAQIFDSIGLSSEFIDFFICFVLGMIMLF